MDDVFIVDSQDNESLEMLCYYALSQFQPDLDTYNNSYEVLNDIIKRVLQSESVITAVIEDGYVDRLYRDCYYNHFSGKHNDFFRNCKRLFLFKSDCSELIGEYKETEMSSNFIGCLVIKPLKVGAIGRTLLNPKYLYSVSERESIFVRVANYTVHLRGMELQVSAFPYSMQDGETLTCAETSLLNIFDYYSNKYSDYKFVLPSDIFKAAKNIGYERNLPSVGMSFMLMSRIMIEFGFYPRLYLKDAIKNDEELLRILSYYIESAIPVALGIQRKDYFNHAVICIGHGNNNIDNMLKKLHRLSTEDLDEDSSESNPMAQSL